MFIISLFIEFPEGKKFNKGLTTKTNMICTIYVDHHAIFVYRRVGGYCYSLPVSVLSVGWLASMLHELLATRREVIF